MLPLGATETVPWGLSPPSRGGGGTSVTVSLTWLRVWGGWGAAASFQSVMHQSHPESRIAMPGRSLVIAAEADAGATEVTMVSVSAATTAPSHFFAVTRAAFKFRLLAPCAPFAASYKTRDKDQR